MHSEFHLIFVLLIVLVYEVVISLNERANLVPEGLARHLKQLQVAILVLRAKTCCLIISKTRMIRLPVNIVEHHIILCERQGPCDAIPLIFTLFSAFKSFFEFIISIL